MWSIQAFSVDGIEKLYIGAAMTMTSAASTSSMSLSASAAASRSVAPRLSTGVMDAASVARLRCGMLSAVRSRSMTVVLGWVARQRSMNSLAIERDCELSPNRLDETKSRLAIAVPPHDGEEPSRRREDEDGGWLSIR